MNNPAIVVVAYNRADSLNRLLSSLEKAKYPKNVKLIISIDKGDNSNVLRIAENFHWLFGEKIVEYQETHLGLRNHILKCGDLAKKYDSLVLLEDDLFVSPMFYIYATEALRFFANDEKIAGISLYSTPMNFLINLPFLPLPDESDIYFMQIPESWGQAWSYKQWRGFKEWFKDNKMGITDKDNLPQPVLNWPESSWTKYFWKYMVEKDKYFVYPRESLTTNFSEPGTHKRKKNYLYQVPLQLYKEKFTFKDFYKSVAVYDQFFEVLPNRLRKTTSFLYKYDFIVDLHGSKQVDKLGSEYIITSKRCKEPILSFGKEMKPIEMNIIENIKGNRLFLCKKESIKENKFSKYFRWNEDFFFYNGDLSLKQLFILLISRRYK